MNVDGHAPRSVFPFVVGIAHAEVVENGDALGVGAHGDELADVLIDAGGALLGLNCSNAKTAIPSAILWFTAMTICRAAILCIDVPAAASKHA
jgi:hypothetical protein